MAVLEAPAQRDTAAVRVRKGRRARRPRQPMPVPMLLLGVVAVFSVGFGMGSLFQFDQDWRSGQPESTQILNAPRQAGVGLSAQVTEMLGSAGVKVTGVQCADDLGNATRTAMTSPRTSAGATGATLGICRADTPAGMVNIVTAESGPQLSVSVYTSR